MQELFFIAEAEFQVNIPAGWFYMNQEKSILTRADQINSNAFPWATPFMKAKYNFGKIKPVKTIQFTL